MKLSRFKAGNGQPASPVVSLSSSSTERELVLAFKAGESTAYAEIDRRNRHMVEHICRRLLKNPHDVEEATQETMLRVLQGLPRFNGRYLLQAWVARIATNVCLDILRARSRRSGLGEPVSEAVHQAAERASAGSQEDPCELVERLEDQERVRGVLAELPPAHRSALVLREFHGLSHEQIAHELDMSAPQVKALIHRAKRGFRRIWETEKPRMGVGLVLPWILTRIRLPRFLRRMAADSATGTAGAAASPAVTAAASMGAERVTAAVAAVVVAGTAGLGAVAAASQGHAAPKPPVFAAAAPSAPKVRFVVTHHHKRRPHHVQHVVAATTTPSQEVGVTDPSPSPTEPSPSPSPSPTEPSPEPTPSPSETTPPPPPPPEPQGFTFGLGSDVVASSYCECGFNPTETDQVSAAQGGVQWFSSTVQNAMATDATGGAAWDLRLSQESPDGQNHNMSFVLTTLDGEFRYTARGSIATRQRTDWGGWALYFSGTYTLSSGPRIGSDVPEQGEYTAAVVISWRQHRVVQVKVALDES